MSERFEPHYLISDLSLSVKEGAIEPWNVAWLAPEKRLRTDLLDLLELNQSLPLETIPEKLLFGEENLVAFALSQEEREAEEDSFARLVRFGICGWLRVLYQKTTSERLRAEIKRFVHTEPCPSCLGTRLARQPFHYMLEGRTFGEVLSGSVEEALTWLRGMSSIDQSLVSAFEALEGLGLGYLGLSRLSESLSRGEFQRLILARNLRNGMQGLTFLFDEPTSGLHASDTEQLCGSIRELVSSGNTAICVEHDPRVIEKADQVIELGPGGGFRGGKILSSGELKESVSHSVAMSGATEMREFSEWLLLKGARKHNLRALDVRIPLNAVVAVSGLSGSGKSSLILETLVPALRACFDGHMVPERYAIDEISGWQNLSGVVCAEGPRAPRISPRSVVATASRIFRPIRELFSMTPAARVHGYLPQHFSFNRPEGWCERCLGTGGDRLGICPRCDGARYRPEVLAIEYKGWSVANLLQLSVEELTRELELIPSIAEPLTNLLDLGLGYLRLGEPTENLSNGERSRLALSVQLLRRKRSKFLYVFEEATRGLHGSEVAFLFEIFRRLVEQGNTVIAIDHHLGLIRASDYVIDLGPGAGASGGRLVAAGPPNEIRNIEQSLTGAYL